MARHRYVETGPDFVSNCTFNTDVLLLFQFFVIVRRRNAMLRVRMRQPNVYSPAVEFQRTPQKTKRHYSFTFTGRRFVRYDISLIYEMKKKLIEFCSKNSTIDHRAVRKMCQRPVAIEHHRSSVLIAF